MSSINYAVAEASTAKDLLIAVHDLIAQGYAPLGGVCVTSSTWHNGRDDYWQTDWNYAQAMTQTNPCPVDLTKGER